MTNEASIVVIILISSVCFYAFVSRFRLANLGSSSLVVSWHDFALMALGGTKYSVRMISALHWSFWRVSHVSRTWWWHLRYELANDYSHIAIVLFIGLFVFHATKSCTVGTTKFWSCLIWIDAILFWTLKWSQCGTLTTDTDSRTRYFLIGVLGELVSIFVFVFITTCIWFRMHSLLSCLIYFFRLNHCSGISGSTELGVNAALLDLHYLTFN